MRKKAIANGVTPVYARQRSRTPTLPQLNAIDLLAVGKTDTQTAEALNLDRTTVTKWRLYDPVFQAALNRRRKEVWSVGIDRLRSLIPKALDALEQALECQDHPHHRLKAAVELLRLAEPPAAPSGSTDADEIVRHLVEARRGRTRSVFDDIAEDDKGLPPFNEHVSEVWSELDAMMKPEESAADAPQP